MLASFLGGSNQASLAADSGPWNEFEVVDGHEKGDIVGIRRSGEDKLCFSIKDFARLPN